MHLRDTLVTAIIAVLLAAIPALAAVSLDPGARKVTKTPQGEKVEQIVAIANTVANYELTYTAEHSADGTRILSDSWGWTQGYVPLGMTGPSQPNCITRRSSTGSSAASIHLRPAKLRVVREMGERDGQCRGDGRHHGVDPLRDG